MQGVIQRSHMFRSAAGAPKLFLRRTNAPVPSSSRRYVQPVTKTFAPTCIAPSCGTSAVGASLAPWLMRCDLAVAVCMVGAIGWRRLLQNDRQICARFFTGAAIGLVWEIGFFLRGPLFSQNPAYTVLSFPLSPWLLPCAHAVWDGGLFLAGAHLVEKLTPAPHFERFRAIELACLIGWGNLQELGVEVLACHLGLWTFIPQPWNPALWRVKGGTITLVPQLIWTVAPIFYYLVLCARSKRKAA